MTIQLRPYQQQLVNDIRLQYQMGRQSVLAVLPTGGGKTCCFSYITHHASIKGNRVLILVHRSELLDQASSSLRRMGVRHGLIQAGRSMDLSHAVQVASVQTLARRLHLLPPSFFQLMVVDEAHHTTAGTWSKVTAHFNAAKLLGVTATPIRGDGRGLGEHYQAMVLGPTAQWLTDHGFLASARVLAPPGFDAAGLRKRMGDFDAKQAEQRATSIHGDCLSHYRQHLNGRTAIAFCCSVAHAEAVAELFNRHGITAASIDGSMDAPHRRRLLSDLGDGRLKVLTSCSLIGEGVDVPSVAGCILLRPTASVALHLQMIGRCLRPQDGKVAVVLDHVGNTLRLGHHMEDREWSLDGERKQQRDAAPSVKVCPKCFATSLSTARVCAECGHVFAPVERRELQTVEGELVELKRELKSGDPIEVRSFEDSAQEWVGGWKFGYIYPPRQWNRRGDKDQNPHPDADPNQPRARCFDPDGKPWSVALCDLRSVSGEAAARERKREQGSAQSLEDLRQLAQQRGYKRGWAERVYQARLAKRHAI